MGLISSLCSKLSLKSDYQITTHASLIATLTQIFSPSEYSAIELDDQILESLLSPESGTLSSYESLPIEIHDQIIAFAEQGDILTNDNPLLKTLRQVSKAFHDIATPRLFHTVVLYQHLDRWEALNNIARHPELVKHVRKIQLACLRELSCTAPGVEDWESTLIGFENFQHPYHYAPMADYPPDGGPLALLDHGDLDQRYARYRLWNDKEKFVSAGDKEKEAPFLDLQLFGPLSIETVGQLELSTVKRKGVDTVTRHAPRPNYCTRRHAETGLAEEGPPLFNGVDAWKTSPLHLHLFIYASMAAGANVTSLTLRHVDELMSGYSGLEVPNLRHLKLDFGIEHTGLYCARRRLGVWLDPGKLDKLEDITVIQQPESEDAVDVLDEFDQTYFPNLRRLTLFSPETTRNALGRFIERHWATLQHVCISEPLMRPSEWAWFLAAISNVEHEETWRYEGKTFSLSHDAKTVVRDEAFANEYWDERWKRPQDQKVLRELSMRVKSVPETGVHIIRDQKAKAIR